MPQSGLLVAEAPAGPFHGAQRCGEPHFELVAVGVGDERLTGGAARGDLVHVAFAVGVGEEVEIQALADGGLVEQRQPGDVIEVADPVPVAEDLPVVGHMHSRVLHESL